jgi:hypothetical protein
MAAHVDRPCGAAHVDRPCGPVGRPLADDTPIEVEERQIEQWRRMSSADKAALISGLTNATLVLARAGLRRRYPPPLSTSRSSAWPC